MTLDRVERLLADPNVAPAPWEVAACATEEDAALIVELRNLAPDLVRAVRAAQAVDRIYEGLRLGENDGEFSLWSEDYLVVALHALRPALAALAGETTP